MRTAVFMRHGHAEDAPSDHDRALTEQGRLAARESAMELRDLGIAPDVLICSTATRALGTAQVVKEVLSFDGGISLRRELYLAEPSTYVQAIRELPDDVHCAVLVAHNPGLEQLLQNLGRPKRLSPSSYGVVQCDVRSWLEFPG